MDIVKEKLNEKDKNTLLSVQDQNTKPHNLENKNALKEVPSICLEPDQIEEIHADEYSLTIFYATRVQPLTIADIKKQFPEPESKKAQSVLDRFIKSGLIHITPEGKYYSNFPQDYINYSNYRYDKDIEARKDAKVFSLMKENSGKTEYWNDKSFFSIDAFYTKEQTQELQKMLYEVKIKAKEYANENSKKKSILGLIFRRFKFYDMTFSFILLAFLSMGLSPSAQAGGNDPTLVKATYYQDIIDEKSIDVFFRSGGGNDPTAVMLRQSPREYIYKSSFGGVNDYESLDVRKKIDKDDSSVGSGGGHDPMCPTCPNPTGGGGYDPGKGKRNPEVPQACGAVIMNSKSQAPSALKPLCKAQRLLSQMIVCEKRQQRNCDLIEDQLLEVLSKDSDIK